MPMGKAMNLIDTRWMDPIERIRQMRERAHTRTPGAVAVQLTIDEHEVAAETRNVNAGGMLVAVDQQLEVGTTVTVTVERGGQLLSAQARVVATRETGTGLEFFQQSAEFRQAIALIITELQDSRGEAESTRDQVNSRGSWAHAEQKKGRWRKRKDERFPAKLFSLSDDGAAMVCIRRPVVDESIVLYLEDPDTAPLRNQTDAPAVTLDTRAVVVRHTARGFAVRFESPGDAFMELVARLRKSRSSPTT